jgi:glycerol uptake facilitator protein
VVLPNTKGNGGGLVAICMAWGLAVFVGVYTTAATSGAHLNPAVTIGMAMAGKFSWSLVPSYILAQFLGAMLGSALAWFSYRDHFNASTVAADKLAVFSTGPGFRNPIQNLYSEILGTFVLVIGCMWMTKSTYSLGTLDALPVGLLVMGIGLGLGGPTGWAINPARDLGPRIMHAILPIPGKGSSDWGYSWVPVVGPIIGGILAALVYQAVL